MLRESTFYGLLGVLGALSLSATATASEPQVAFALKKGWLEFTLQQDGKPLSEAVVRVLDDQGTQFVEGETGASGRGSFPLNRGDTFFLEIKIGDRTADPITLHRTSDGISPDRVLLSFGLRPCCRVPSRGGVYRVAELEPSPIPPSRTIPWLPLLAVVGCLLGGLSLVIVAARSGMRGTS